MGLATTEVIANSSSHVSEDIELKDLSVPDFAPDASPLRTLVDDGPPDTEQQEESTPSNFRRYSLLVLFCLAQFMDAFNGSALFAAIPTLVSKLGFTTGESAWIVSAYQLAFAAFLLISGRVSDVFTPKYVFVCGITVMGCISIGLGFTREKILFLVLRAFAGAFAALTIPSSLTLIICLFPKPAEQARAIGMFGGCGCLGNVLGLVIGAIFVQLAGWPWVFYFVALVAIPIGGICLVSIPHPRRADGGDRTSAREKWKRFDLFGVGNLTASLIVLIFALTSSSAAGWASAEVLAPLIISVFMLVLFFVYETKIPEAKASVPPRIWFYPNFSVLMALVVTPTLWWNVVGFTFPSLWQDIYKWPIISVAVHMIPVGVFSGIVSFSGPLSAKFGPRNMLVCGHILALTGTILLTFANSRDKYWSIVFPGFVVGASGCMMIYTHTNIAIFANTPPSIAGTVGAMFNCVLQLGGAVGLAVANTIVASIDEKSADPDTYKGRSAAWWFVFAVIAVEFVALLVFYRVRPKREARSPPLERTSVELEQTPRAGTSVERVSVSVSGGADKGSSTDE